MFVTCWRVDAVAQALADPSRREILRMLRGQPMNAGEIAGAFSVSRPAISRHLRVLREAGLVSDELIGRERAYSLTLEALAELEAFLAELHAPSRWERRLMALETEVHRVKRGRRRVAPTRVRQNYNRKESA
jgi:DNA-binding transcriptional ArsR family regulator